MNNIILLIAMVLKIIYEITYFPHGVSNALIITKKDGSEFPNTLLNYLLNIDWKVMPKDFVIALGNLMPSTPLIRLHTD